MKVLMFGNPYKVGEVEIKFQTRVEQCLYLFIELLLHIIIIIIAYPSSATFGPFSFDFMVVVFCFVHLTPSVFVCSKLVLFTYNANKDFSNL